MSTSRRYAFLKLNFPSVNGCTTYRTGQDREEPCSATLCIKVSHTVYKGVSSALWSPRLNGLYSVLHSHRPWPSCGKDQFTCSDPFEASQLSTSERGTASALAVPISPPARPLQECGMDADRHKPPVSPHLVNDHLCGPLIACTPLVKLSNESIHTRDNLQPEGSRE